MALKTILQDEDIAQELILYSNSDAHISDDDISPQSDSNTEEANRKNTDCRDWTNTTQTLSPMPMIHKFTGEPSGLRQNEAPHMNKDLSPLSTFMLFFLEIIQQVVKETNILPSIFGHTK
jgi:hypothetical protein